MRQLGDEVRHELAGVWARSGLMLESTITLLPLLLTQSNSVLNPEFKQPFEFGPRPGGRGPSLMGPGMSDAVCVTR